MVLFTPGPVSVKRSILSSAAKPVLFHRAKPFQKLLVNISRKANLVFGANKQYITLILNGSGTLANESVIVSLIPSRKKLMVVSNGGFGERLAEIAKINNLNLIHLKKPWTSRITREEVDAVIKREKPYMLAVVALETSTGMVNPIKEIGNLCANYGILFFVDAVSALGAENINVVQDKIDVCVSVPNKAIESLPGLSLVCIKENLLQKIKSNIPRTYSLDLLRYYDWYLKGQTPTTPPVSLYVVLDCALDNLIEETLEKRKQRYLYLSEIVRELASKIGVHELINEQRDKATAITSLCFPKEVNVESLHGFLLKSDFVVWFNSHIELNKNKNMLQISVMGDIKKSDIKRLFILISDYIKKT